MSVWTERPASIPVATAETTDRLTFIKKVYSILAISLLSGIISATLTLGNQEFLAMVARNRLLFFILEIAVILACFWKRKHATLGFVFLFAFTTLTGITVAPIVFVYQAVAFPAAFLTAIAFGGLTAYAFFTKKDFSFLRGFLTVGIILLIAGGLLNAFFFKSFNLQYLMAWGGAFLFSGFILYDTSNIINHYKTDEYIAGALSLYLDILNLFVSLLFILGGRRS